jgi:hypothetical protein
VLLYPLPAKDKHPALADMSRVEYDLLAVMVRAMQGLLRAVRKHETRAFNNWLAATRDAAGGVGQAAVRRAAAERVHEETLSRERKMLLGVSLTQWDGLCSARGLWTKSTN